MVQVSPRRKLTGLDTNTNPFNLNLGTAVSGPAGRTVICNNAMINRSGMIVNRWGFNYWTEGITAQVLSFFEYQSAGPNHFHVVEWQADDTLWLTHSDDQTRTQYSGTYEAPFGFRMDGTVSQGNLYLTTNNGPYKLDDVDSTPIRAGLTKGLDVRVTATGNPGWLNGFGEVAYVITWTRTDAQGLTLQSTPSEPFIYTSNNRVSVSSLTRSVSTATVTTSTNHGFTSGDDITISGATQEEYNGTYNITVGSPTTFTYTVSGTPASPATGTITAELYTNTEVEFTAPWDALGTDTWSVYRTFTADADAPSPGATFYLVSYGTLAGSSASPGDTITFTDTTADSSLIVQLYTNANVDTASQGNDRPPVAGCIGTYNNYTVYGNCALDHEAIIELLTVSSGIANGSEIIITDVDTSITHTYTAGAAENTATNTFLLETSLGSAAQNIQATMRSFAHVVNSDPDGTTYCEYYSGVNDPPGTVRIWAREPITGAFFLTANNTGTGEAFTPELPTSGQAVLSDNDYQPNAMYFSKAQIPEGVPVDNVILIGRKDYPIQRIIAIRNQLYVLKGDGVFVFTNANQLPAQPTPLDRTCQILAAASAVALNNSIYMLSNQGVVRINDSGADIISKLIAPDIDAILSLENLQDVCFGVAHESEHLFCLWVPTGGGDTYAQQAYVFNTIEGEWVRWEKPAAGGIALLANRKMYLSSGIEDVILQQRKNLDETDKQDESVPCTIVSQDDDEVTVTWTNTAFTPTIGYALEQDEAFARVIAVANTAEDTWVFTIDRDVEFDPGAATGNVPIYLHVRAGPDICGEAGTTKEFYATSVFTLQPVTLLAIEVSTNDSVVLNSYDVPGYPLIGWGESAWGDAQYGDAFNPGGNVANTIAVPDSNTGETITVGAYHAIAGENCQIVNIATSFDVLSEVETA